MRPEICELPIQKFSMATSTMVKKCDKLLQLKDERFTKTSLPENSGTLVPFRDSPLQSHVCKLSESVEVTMIWMKERETRRKEAVAKLVSDMRLPCTITDIGKNIYLRTRIVFLQEHDTNHIFDKSVNENEQIMKGEEVGDHEIKEEV